MMSSRSVFWLFRHVRFIDLLAWSWPWMVIVWMLSCGFFNMSGEPCYLFLHHCQLHVPSYCALTCTARWRQLTQYNCSSMFMSCGSVLWCPEWNFTEELIILESRGCLCPIDLKPGVPWGPEGQGLAGLQVAAGPIGGELCGWWGRATGRGRLLPHSHEGTAEGPLEVQAAVAEAYQAPRPWPACRHFRCEVRGRERLSGTVVTSLAGEFLHWFTEKYVGNSFFLMCCGFFGSLFSPTPLFLDFVSKLKSVFFFPI